MSFDGAGEKVDMGSALDVGQTDFTLEAFVYVNTNGASEFGAIAGKVVSGVFLDRGWVLQSRPDLLNGGGEAGPGKWKALFRTRDGGAANDIFSADLEFNTWYHLAGVRNGDTLSLYLDGNLVESQALANTGDYTSGQAFAVGGAVSGAGEFANVLNGFVDEVRLSDVAIDPSQFLLNVANPPDLEGDLNGDGFVGQDDLNIILGAWGQNVNPPGDPMTGDPSNDGFVGQDDLNFVLGDWGQGTPPSGLNAVPEPQGVLLIALAAAGAIPLVRRRRKE